jgi:hypothetical protein
MKESKERNKTLVAIFEKIQPVVSIWCVNIRNL